MRIRGLDNLTFSELQAELASGGRFVFFEYCVSLLVVTTRRPSDVWLVRAGQRTLRQKLKYSLISLLLGWWGIPWGVIYTPLTLITNWKGGCDVTEQLRPHSPEEFEQLQKLGISSE